MTLGAACSNQDHALSFSPQVTTHVSPWPLSCLPHKCVWWKPITSGPHRTSRPLWLWILSASSSLCWRGRKSTTLPPWWVSEAAVVSQVTAGVWVKSLVNQATVVSEWMKWRWWVKSRLVNKWKHRWMTIHTVVHETTAVSEWVSEVAVVSEVAIGEQMKRLVNRSTVVREATVVSKWTKL